MPFHCVGDVGVKKGNRPDHPSLISMYESEAKTVCTAVPLE